MVIKNIKLNLKNRKLLKSVFFNQKARHKKGKLMKVWRIKKCQI